MLPAVATATDRAKPHNLNTCASSAMASPPGVFVCSAYICEQGGQPPHHVAMPGDTRCGRCGGGNAVCLGHQSQGIDTDWADADRITRCALVRVPCISGPATSTATSAARSAAASTRTMVGNTRTIAATTVGGGECADGGGWMSVGQ